MTPDSPRAGTARDWGVDTEPIPSSWPRAALPAAQLPEVLTARGDHWFLAPDAPMWAFLPAVWPPRHRRWLEDRSIRWVRISCSGSPPVQLPWSAWDHLQSERDVNELLLSCSVPARPPARLWLLRPPTTFPDLDSAVGRIADTVARSGLDVRCSPELVELTERVVGDLFRDDT